MRKIWTDNPDEILHELNFVVNKKIKVCLCSSAETPVTSSFLKIHVYHGESYIIIRIPYNGESIIGEVTVLYRVEGAPVMGFTSEINKRTDKLFAAMILVEMFIVQKL